jgi:hypothetical protein
MGQFKFPLTLSDDTNVIAQVTTWPVSCQPDEACLLLHRRDAVLTDGDIMTESDYSEEGKNQQK